MSSKIESSFGMFVELDVFHEHTKPVVGVMEISSSDAGGLPVTRAAELVVGGEHSYTHLYNGSSPGVIPQGIVANLIVGTSPLQELHVVVRADLRIESSDGLKLDVPDAFKETPRQVFFWG